MVSRWEARARQVRLVPRQSAAIAPLWSSSRALTVSTVATTTTGAVPAASNSIAAG